MQPAFQLTAGHFAFVRAVLQGVEPHASWSQYLDIDGRPATPHDIRQMMGNIRNAFAVASKQHRRPGTARLVLSGLRIGDRKDSATTALADFVAANALDGFSEVEQLAFYAQQFGTLSHKRARLLARQLDAVNWLQQVASQPTLQHETIDGWLEPHLANRLAEAGIKRTAALRHLIQRRPDRWWHGIKTIGVIKAARITAALPRLSEPVNRNDDVEPLAGGAADWQSGRQNHMTPSSGHAPSDASFAALHCLPTGLAPDCGAHVWLSPEHLESSVNPADLKAVRRWLEIGVSRRGNRSDTQRHVTVPVDSSPEIVSSGIVMHPTILRGSERGGLPPSTRQLAESLTHTQRAYWKEAQRFLLWLTIERHATLETLTAHDCSAYVVFMEAPEARWCGLRARGRADPAWRPFEGPLSPQMRSYAVNVLRSLCRFLVNEGTLRASPWENASADPVDRLTSGQRNVPRVFDLDAWAIIERTLGEIAPTSANDRLRVAIHLLRTSGMRLGELVRASVGDLDAPATPLRPWQLRRRCATGSLPAALVPPDAVRLLRAYFVTRGLNPLLLAAENRGARLLGKATDAGQRALRASCGQAPVDPRDGIGLGTMADQLRAFFQLCAQACVDQPDLARQFEQANSHWLRGEPEVQRVARGKVDAS